MAASRLRAIAIPSGRSDASRPASPNRSRTRVARQRRGGRRRAGRQRTAPGPGRAASRSPRPARRPSRRWRAPGSRTARSRALPSGRGDDRAGALEHDHRAPGRRRIAGRRQPGLVVVGDRSPSSARVVAAARAQPRELAGVRGQDGRPALALPPARPSSPSTAAPRRRARSGGQLVGLAGDRPAASGRARSWPARAAARDRRRARRARGRGSGRGPAPGRSPRRRPRAAPSSSPRRPSPRTAAGAIRAPPG